MLNVITLRPAQKNKSGENPARSPPNLRHHVLTEAMQKNSGRLGCSEEDDGDEEASQSDIYAAR